MSAIVAFELSKLRAVERGLRALDAERVVLERHGMVSPELEFDIAELEELRDRMKAGRESALPMRSFVVREARTR